ncbi:Relaxase/Mobilisation nuclease domain-containing protein [Chryseobacterium arachidis]|uniref:Relaxase/Mobilisation nuclease domain-containing protein n=1 Tax=Chryseobacterium arachidis TaxID=1416778 RepID=A0A1M5GWY2_9FLAO|nr:conjugal transfer protein MobB [Chryseobacterium arachidis]SHG08233.1 Relaxase/Mobilisation nuclease domain-containing protein [Chryseobacterium arachidis]
MIAKIGRGNSLFGALAYNQLKVENENGKILYMNKMIETKNGKYSVSQLASSFEPYLIANKNTEKATLHISLNPDPKDQVSDEKFIQIARDYMDEMGYGEQPYVVFKHTDISRTHIHIVSVGVDEEGKKISDKFEKRKSMKLCREIEKKYQLLSAKDRELTQNEKIFTPVDYRYGDIKRQLASVVRNISKYYQFQTIGEYNALLSLFNITAEKVENLENGVLKDGLLYFALNDKGEKVSQPFKASLFGKDAGLKVLSAHLLQSKEALKANPFHETLKVALILAKKNQPNELEFKKKLQEIGISTVIRRNITGRIYGVTFIDHQSKSVWNGSRLGKEFSANAFNKIWNGVDNPEKQKKSEREKVNSIKDDVKISYFERPHKLFDFLDSESISVINGIGTILPESQGENYEELDFENRMKKKKLQKPKK